MIGNKTRRQIRAMSESQHNLCEIMEDCLIRLPDRSPEILEPIEDFTEAVATAYAKSEVERLIGLIPDCKGLTSDQKQNYKKLIRFTK